MHYIPGTIFFILPKFEYTLVVKALNVLNKLHFKSNCNLINYI